MKKQLTITLALVLLFGALPLDPIFAAIFSDASIEEMSEDGTDFSVGGQVAPGSIVPDDEVEVVVPEERAMGDNGGYHHTDLDRGPPEAEVNAIESLVEQGISSLSQGQLTLGWQANNSEDHLALDPRANTRQSHIFELNFSPLSTNTYAPGDIEIRLPRALFEDRDGNLILQTQLDGSSSGQSINNRLPSMHVPLPGDTAFNYTIDSEADEVVISNFVAVSGETHLRIEFLMRYLPSQTANGFTNEFTATVTFASNHGREPVESNELSLDLTTRVVPRSNTKTTQQLYQNWQPAWGARPENARNYFFVRYRLAYGTTSTTTQPFSARLVDNPSGNGSMVDGEIVAWSAIAQMSHLGALTNFTTGATEEFNELLARNWQVNIPGPLSSSNQRYQDIIVQYRRTGEEDQTVQNRMEVVYTPIDHATDPVANPILERRDSDTAVFNYMAFTYSGNLFAIHKQMGGSTSAVLPTLDRGESASIPQGGMVSAYARGFSYTNNGRDPFTTTLIDDHVYLNIATGPHAGMHRLEPEDFRFDRISIHNYIETTVARDEEGNPYQTLRVPNAERSPIRFYYQALGQEGWQYFRTYEPGTSPGSGIFDLPDKDIHQIKAVHDNGIYRVEFDLMFWIQLNPTNRVLSLTENQESVELMNFAALIVYDYNGNRMNRLQESNYLGTVYERFIARDREIFGPHLAQRWTDTRRLTRPAFHTTLHKVVRNPNVVSQPEHARVVVPYRIVLQNNLVSHSGFSDELFQLLIPEQTEGIFYDLLPMGALLDPTSIVARNVNQQIVDFEVFQHENWQNSGRTLIEIRVRATADTIGTNWRNADSNSLTNNMVGTNVWMGGTGFMVDFDVFYPWSSVGLFGTQLRNLASYQSGSGELFQGHTNANNTTGAFTPGEQGWMSNFPSGVDPNERNTISTLNTVTVDPVTSDQLGFRKMVRATGDAYYSMSTAVLPGGTYSYRLQYVGPQEDETMNLVMFDVLEDAHNERDYWQGTFESIDLSHPRLIGIAPVVYFSTQSGLDVMGNPAHANLSNGAIWTTTQPADRSTITAVAIDLSTGINGEPFVFAPTTGTVVNIHMRAPHDYTLYNNIAYNRAQYRITTLPVTGGAPINWPIAEVPYTQVTLLPREVSITKESDPASGTATNPAGVEVGSTVNYSIRVENNEELALRNVVVEDNIPAFMSFDAEELLGFFGDDARTAIPLSEHTRVTYRVTGNRIEWTISTLGAGEAFTIIIPAVIDEDLAERTVFENTARIIRIDGVDYDIESETTYHVAEPDPSDPLPPTIEKSADREYVFEGEEIEYTITVRNPNVTHVWEDLVVVDQIRVDLVEFLEDTLYIDGEPAPAGSWSFDIDTGELRVYIDSIEPQQEVEITFSVRVLVTEDEDEEPIDPEARIGIVQALMNQSLFSAQDASGYVGIEPSGIWTSSRFVIYTSTGRLNEQANIDVLGNYQVTNFNSVFRFTHWQHYSLWPEEACRAGGGISRCTDVHSTMVRHTAIISASGELLAIPSTTVMPRTYGYDSQVENAFFRDIEHLLPQGIYEIHMHGYWWGLDYTDYNNGDSGFIFNNIQRTSSFVDIDGTRITEDSSMCPIVASNIVNPDSGEYIRCDSETLPEPVLNPSVITVGRPEFEVHGQYTATWVIEDENGNVVATGTGTAPIDVHTHPDLGDSLIPGIIYTVRVTITEVVTIDSDQNIYFPVDPNHPDGFISESIGRFVFENDNDEPIPGTIPNTAILYCVDGEDEVECGRDTEIVVVLQHPSITKGVNVAPGTPVEIGEYVTYTLTVTNPNEVNLYDYIVVDNLAGGVLIGVRYIEVDPDVGYEILSTTGELSVLLDYLPADGSVTITFQARVAPGTPVGPVLNVVHLYDYDPETGDRTFVEDCDEVIILEEEPTTAPTEPETTVPETTVPETTTVPATTTPTDPSEPTTAPEPTTVPAPTTPTDPSEPTTAPATTAPTEPDLVDPTLEKQVCVLEEVDSLFELVLQLIALEGEVCEFGDAATAEIGQTARYRITVNNPNDVTIYDFLVVDTLDLDLVDFLGNVQIDGRIAASPADYTFNEETGELRVYLAELPATGVIITFDVMVLAGDENDEIPNTAYLFGPEDGETGDRDVITEDNALITVEEDPEPTTVPETTSPEETTTPETTIPDTTAPEDTQPATTDPSEPTTAPTQPTETDPIPTETEPSEPTTVPATEPGLEDPTLDKEVCSLEPVEADSLIARLLQLVEETSCEFGVLTGNVSRDQEIGYAITVSNPNAVNLYDFLAIDNLANGALVNVRNIVVTPDLGYTIEEYEDELRIRLDVLPANGTIVITFVADLADWVEPGSIVNEAYLYGPPGDDGERDRIREDDEEIILEEDPQSTTVPATTGPTQPTTVPETSAPSEPTTVPEPTETEPTPTQPTDPDLSDPTLTKTANRQMAELGDVIEYRLTVNNPNNENLYDFVVVDILNLDLVEFVPGSVRINGSLADYVFNPVTGELRVYLATLPPGNTNVTFEVIVLAGNEDDEVPNRAHLYGPPIIDEETGEPSDRPVIDEDDEVVRIPTPTVPETTPPTTCPEEGECPTQPECPELETCPTESTDPTEEEARVPVPRPTEPNRRPNLPQTGAIAGSALLGGAVLTGTGLALTAKKRKQDK